MIQPGDQIPFFEVRTTDGLRVAYRDLWQRSNVALVLIPSREGAFEAYVSSLTRRMVELTAHDTAVVITSDPIDGVPSPAVIIGDRWGEIHHVVEGVDAAQMPTPDALIEWLRYVQSQCPECQGETR